MKLFKLGDFTVLFIYAFINTVLEETQLMRPGELAGLDKLHIRYSVIPKGIQENVAGNVFSTSSLPLRAKVTNNRI
jgi:hypothetical protein